MILFMLNNLIPFNPIRHIKQKNTMIRIIVLMLGDPMENRTPIARMRTWCPNR